MSNTLRIEPVTDRTWPVAFLRHRSGEPGLASRARPGTSQDHLSALRAYDSRALVEYPL